MIEASLFAFGAPQLSAPPLMEPVLGLDLSLFPPYGSSSLGRDSVLSGSFGNACLDGVADYYTQLACKVGGGEFSLLRP